jgi:uncharacterized protein
MIAPHSPPTGRLPPRRVCAVAVGLVLVVLGACTARTEAPARGAAAFRTGLVEIVSGAATVRLHVEIAETPAQRDLGLSGRTRIGEHAGMIFLFETEQPPASGFWMRGTAFPLSIAFLDADGFIRAIREMEPCGRRPSLFCPRYRAGVPYRAALEVSSGFFERKGVQVGDRVILYRE